MTDKIEKKYFSIGEVAGTLNVSASLIRFWETQFDQIKPRKNKNGVRQYTRNDMEILQTIYHLVKEKGYTLQGAKDTMKQKKTKASDKVDLINKLHEIKGFLSDLKVSLSDEEDSEIGNLEKTATTSFD